MWLLLLIHELNYAPLHYFFLLPDTSMLTYLIATHGRRCVFYFSSSFTHTFCEMPFISLFAFAFNLFTYFLRGKKEGPYSFRERKEGACSFLSSLSDHTDRHARIMHIIQQRKSQSLSRIIITNKS